MGRFRTPSLRNVAVTAPYMHDGSVATLAEAIGHYAAGGRTIPTGVHTGVGAASPRKSGLLRGFTLSAAEKADLIAFLDPAFADPWPKDHPARANRRPAAAPEAPTQPKEPRP
jgi:cytochrome c peroxidase